MGRMPNPTNTMNSEMPSPVQHRARYNKNSMVRQLQQQVQQQQQQQQQRATTSTTTTTASISKHNQIRPSSFCKRRRVLFTSSSSSSSSSSAMGLLRLLRYVLALLAVVSFLVVFFYVESESAQAIRSDSAMSTQPLVQPKTPYWLVPLSSGGGGGDQAGSVRRAAASERSLAVTEPPSATVASDAADTADQLIRGSPKKGMEHPSPALEKPASAVQEESVAGKKPAEPANHQVGDELQPASANQGLSVDENQHTEPQTAEQSSREVASTTSLDKAEEEAVATKPESTNHQVDEELVPASDNQVLEDGDSYAAPQTAEQTTGGVPSSATTEESAAVEANFVAKPEPTGHQVDDELEPASANQVLGDENHHAAAQNAEPSTREVHESQVNEENHEPPNKAALSASDTSEEKGEAQPAPHADEATTHNNELSPSTNQQTSADPTTTRDAAPQTEGGPLLLQPASVPGDQPLFVVLGDSRSGTEWIMNVLDQHPHVCASGTFNVGGLAPGGFPWLDDSDGSKSSTYRFLRDQVRHFTTDENKNSSCIPEFLASDEAKNGALGSNLPRVCNFVTALQGDYTDKAIVKLFVDSFRSEQHMEGSCPEESRTRGLKVLADWPGEIPLHETAIAGQKVIRFRRKNLWARFMSIKLAEASNVWGISSADDKARQLEAVTEKITVDVDDMLGYFDYIQQFDRKGDEWAETYASDTLWLEYEECRERPEECFGRIYDFLGVDKSHITAFPGGYEASFPTSNSDAVLDYVSNPDVLREVLGAIGMGEFIGMNHYAELQILVRHSPSGRFVRMPVQQPGVHFALIEPDTGSTASQFSAVVTHLQGMSPDELVIIGDGGYSSLNIHVRGLSVLYKAIVNAREAYDELTRDRPGSIVFATDSNCCTSALTHVEPGAFFDSDGKRKTRSCTSGEEGCQWNGDDKATIWQQSMKELAQQRSAGTTERVYLDASLMAGTAQNLLSFLAQVDIGATEDAHAVLADFMLYKPDMVVLDYEQRLFGQGFDGVKSATNAGCPFPASENFESLSAERLPLFGHTPRDLGCSSTSASDNTALSFPQWDEGGIKFQPILDHIDELLEKNESVFGSNLHFGPEVPYVVDEQGVWTSEKIQARINNETSHFRVKPTEKILVLAHKLLTESQETGSRWSALRSSIEKGGFAFFGWTGDLKDCNFKNTGEESIPIFSTCAIGGCTHAFPSPAYMTIIDSQTSTQEWHKIFRQFDTNYPWDKKIRKVVWRGQLSESDPSKVFESARWRLAKLVTNSKSDIFDVGFVGIPSFLTDQMEIDVSQVGGLVDSIKPMNAFMQYAAILDLDGNSWSSRFGSLLCMNSVTVKVEPSYFDYFHYDLQPWKHYVPVKADFSDLEEAVAFTMDPANEAVVKHIIASANQWCAQRFVHSELARDQLDIWNDYVSRLDFHDPEWNKKWSDKKSGENFSSNLALKRLGQF